MSTIDKYYEGEDGYDDDDDEEDYKDDGGGGYKKELKLKEALRNYN